MLAAKGTYPAYSDPKPERWHATFAGQKFCTSLDRIDAHKVNTYKRVVARRLQLDPNSAYAWRLAMARVVIEKKSGGTFLIKRAEGGSVVFSLLTPLESDDAPSHSLDAPTVKRGWRS